MSSYFQNPVRIGLLDFLKNSVNSQLIVPIYQRNYTWTEQKEVEQYLQDLKTILISGSTNHFLGIIIYLDIPLNFSQREFSIIDGQQRITTTFLTLYAIKAIMKQNNTKAAINNLNQYLYTNWFNEKDHKPKLKPQVADDSVYQYIVEDKIDQIENKKSQVYKNYTYILAFIKQLAKNYSLDKILNALNKLHVVSIPLSQSYDDPQKIFESINSTGMKLTVSQLIKNYLLMDLDSEKQEKYYIKYWDQIIKLLNSNEQIAENFFRLFLNIMNQKTVDQNIIYQHFVKWCNDFEKKHSRENTFEEIIKYVRYYHQIHIQKPTSLALNIQESIKDYQAIGLYSATCLLMSLFDLYSNKKLLDKELNSLIKTVNIYLIRRAFCGLDIANLYELFNSLTNKIKNNCANNCNDIELLLKSYLFNDGAQKKWNVPNDIELYNSIINANMYKNKHILRLFFDKLEHEGNNAKVDLSKLNIEHIAPRNANEKWLKALGVDKEEYLSQINRLGNLTLASITDNNKMKNDDWTKKKKILSRTKHIKINEEIRSKEQWNIDEIDKRTKSLIKSINRLFPYLKVNNNLNNKENNTNNQK